MTTIESFMRKTGHNRDICSGSKDKCVCGYNEAIGVVRESVFISRQHAYSLREMVKWFRLLITKAEIPDLPNNSGRSDDLTVGYCDELLEDLNG